MTKRTCGECCCFGEPTSVGYHECEWFCQPRRSTDPACGYFARSERSRAAVASQDAYVSGIEVGHMEGFERVALPILSRPWANDWLGPDEGGGDLRCCPWCGMPETHDHCEWCALRLIMRACGIAD